MLLIAITAGAWLAGSPHPRRSSHVPLASRWPAHAWRIEGGVVRLDRPLPMLAKDLEIALDALGASR